MEKEAFITGCGHNVIRTKRCQQERQNCGSRPSIGETKTKGEITGKMVELSEKRPRRGTSKKNGTTGKGKLAELKDKNKQLTNGQKAKKRN